MKAQDLRALTEILATYIDVVMATGPKKWRQSQDRGTFTAANRRPIDSIYAPACGAETQFRGPGSPPLQLLSDTITPLYLYPELRPKEMSWQAN